MKLKGIPVWEQHVEKIVIGGVGACLLGALAWQFLSPTTVAVGKEKVAPGRAFEPVQRAAETLQARLQSEQFTPPQVPQGDIAAQFTERLRAPLLPDATTIVALGPGLNLGAATGAAVASDAPFNIPVVPAPTLPAAHAFWSTLDPREVARHVRAPILLLHGDTDRQVPPPHADELAAVLRANGAPLVQVRHLPRTNHLLLPDGDGDPQGYVRLPDQRIRREVVEAVAAFLAQQLDVTPATAERRSATEKPAFPRENRR